VRPLSSHARGLFVTLAAAAFFLASLGLVPTRAWIAGWFGGISSERFPCEDHGCGCASSDECWNACCCHTIEERVAWAIANGVRPPAAFHLTPEQWSIAVRLAAPVQHRGCCSPREEAGSDDGTDRLVLRHTRPGLIRAMLTAPSCKGGSPTAPAGLPPVPPCERHDYLVLLPAFCGLVEPRDAVWRTRVIDPAVPPPRI